MKIRLLCGMVLACCSLTAQADPYYTGNPYTPYPPGCATLPARQMDLYGGNAVRFWSGSLWLEVVNKIVTFTPQKNLGLVDLDLYRVGCAEPGRSIIVAEFHLPSEWVDPRNSQLVLPIFAFPIHDGWDHIPLELKAEPNTWGQMLQEQAFTKQAIGDFTNGWDDARRFTWRYVLDMGAAASGWGAEDVTDLYNEYFGPLYIFRNHDIAAWLNIPATNELLQPNPTLPLNGRLTGTWVEDGAADQGFVLSVSSPIQPARPESEAEAPEDSELLAFLSWFTFDAQGNGLWLTGNARFPQGSSEVSIPIVQVTEGQFLGEKAAQRRVVGSARLKALSCNELQIEYDLTNLDLDAGNMRLQRVQALEIAGYPCRDYKARQTSLYSDNTQ